jgi:hypothetical protein
LRICDVVNTGGATFTIFSGDPDQAAQEDAVATQLELMLDPNGDQIKLMWCKENGPFSKPLKYSTAALAALSHGVRSALSELNSYVRTNQDLQEEKDPGWKRYAAAMLELRQQGAALYNELFHDDENPHIEALLQALQSLEPGGELRVHCSDEVASLPLGFVFDGDARPLGGNPSRPDFAGFWLERFRITMLVAGSGATDIVIKPDTLKAVYALHRAEVENSLPYLGSDGGRLKQLVRIPVNEHFDWDSARHACASVGNADSIIFVLAHSDGDWLELDGNSKIDCRGFAKMLRSGRAADHAVLLVLNCCLSATGGEGRSLLSAVAQPGFCGLIGTEAEILNSSALRCGARLMWGLCFEGLDLGAAFEQMQHAEDLFPLNLFYTCYAERHFRLERPLPMPEAA